MANPAPSNLKDENGKQKAGPGRPPGSPNKTGAQIRDAVINSFFAIGGEEWLTKLAKDEPKTFAMLMAKCMPQAVQQVGDDGKAVPLAIKIVYEKPENKDVKP